MRTPLNFSSKTLHYAPKQNEKQVGRDGGMRQHNTLKRQANATAAGPPGSRSERRPGIREGAKTTRATIRGDPGGRRLQMAAGEQRSRSEGSRSRFQGLKIVQEGEELAEEPPRVRLVTLLERQIY